VKIAQIIRDARRTELERDELHRAIREISRVRIMDGLSAIRMRSIAHAALSHVKTMEDA
jgi:hypothetical protein